MLRSIVNLISAFGTSSIEVFEADRSQIDLDRLPDNQPWLSFAHSDPPLSFSGWRLAQAVVQADFLIQGNTALSSLGFLFEMDRVLAFGAPAGLSLAPGAASMLADVTQSSVIGRLGQGLAILFAQDRGHVFAGHLASDPEVIAHAASHGKQKAADFLFETVTGDRAIVEAKATFNMATNQPIKAKGVLRKALHRQIDPWMKLLTPPPKKGYAVYSCLREVSGAPSSIIFVDPPEDDPKDPLEVPKAWVRKRTYAAWLAAMGYWQAAQRLVGAGEIEPELVELPMLDIDGHSYAVSPSAVGSGGAVLAVGVEVDALLAVQNAIIQTDDDLLRYRPYVERAPPSRANASFFPDGSFFGLVDPKELDRTQAFFL